MKNIKYTEISSEEVVIPAIKKTFEYFIDGKRYEYKLTAVNEFWLDGNEVRRVILSGIAAERGASQTDKCAECSGTNGGHYITCSQVF